MLGLFGSPDNLPDNPFREEKDSPFDARIRNLQIAINHEKHQKTKFGINGPKAAPYDINPSSRHLDGIHLDCYAPFPDEKKQENELSPFTDERTNKAQFSPDRFILTRTVGSVKRKSEIGFNKLIELPAKTQTKIVKNNSGVIFHLPFVFGNYNLIKQIGAGSYGVIVLVEDQSSHEKYAAKLVTKSDMEKQQKELKILLNFQHCPKIIKVYDAFRMKISDDEYYVIITEYCENGSFYDFIKKFKDNQIVMDSKYYNKIFYEVLVAINYLHRQGVCHGDIKPENILFDKNSQAKLCDFGFSKSTSESTEGNKQGTPEFASPELFSKDSYDILKADIWAIGMTFYVMEYGKFPYEYSRDKDVIKKRIIECNFNFDLGNIFQNFVAKCIQKDPSERPSIDVLIRDSLFTEL